MALKRFTIGVAVAGLCVVGAPAYAQSTSALQVQLAAASPDQAHGVVVASLEAGGYRILQIRRSLLGRIRITAANNVHVREIVVSPNTGEILRDAILRQLTAVEVGGSAGGGGTSEESTSAVGSTVGKVTSTVKETVGDVSSKTKETTKKVKDTVGGATGGLGLGG